MKIINRYILKECTVYTLISLVTFTGLLLIGRILKLTSLIVNKGVELKQIAMVFIAIVPTFLEIAVPMSVLLGIMMAFTRMSGDSEVVVVRSSGISLAQLIKPILIFGFITSLIALAISLQARPWGYRQLSETLFEIARSKTTSGLSEGFFNKLGNLTLYAEEIDQQGNLKHVLIDDKRDPKERKVIFARVGKIGAEIEKQKILINLALGSIHERSDVSYSLTKFDTNSIAIDSNELYTDDSTQKDKRQTEMTMTELNSAIRTTDDKTRKRKLRMERQRRFSMPFASLILALMAMPLGVVSPRAQKTWGASLCVVLGLVTFVLYFGMLSISVALGEKGTIPTWLAAWLPNLISLSATIYLLKNICSEKWLSITDAISDFFKKIKSKIKSNLKK